MATLVEGLSRMGQQVLQKCLPPSAAPAVPSTVTTRDVAVVMPWFIGDTILALTLLQNLRAQLPTGQSLYVVAAPAHQNVLESVSGIQAVYAPPAGIADKARLLRRLGVNTMFLLNYSLSWALAATLAGLRYRVGFDWERFGTDRLRYWGGLLTHSAASGSFRSERHHTQGFREMLALLGMGWAEPSLPTIRLTDADYENAALLLTGFPAPHVVLHITAGSPGKRWPFRHWRELLVTLAGQHPFSFVAVGTRKDAPFYDRLARVANVPILNLCGKTTLRVSAALCQQAAHVITLDTALAHLAAAVRTPHLTVIYGPTNPHTWRPLVNPQWTRLTQVYRPVACRPCITRGCYHRACLNQLTPQRVLQAAGLWQGDTDQGPEEQEYMLSWEGGVKSPILKKQLNLHLLQTGTAQQIDRFYPTGGS